MVTKEQKLVIGLGAVAHRGRPGEGASAERAVSVDRRPLAIQARRRRMRVASVINSEGHGGHASLCPPYEFDGSRVEQWPDASPAFAEMPPHLLLPPGDPRCQTLADNNERCAAVGTALRLRSP